MKNYARQFYSSKAWQHTRESYRKSKRNLCEVCLAKGLITPAEIVHHKIEITPDNITDQNITLNWDNLQCVCRDCHAAVHEKNYEKYRYGNARKRRYTIDKDGKVKIRSE